MVGASRTGKLRGLTGLIWIFGPFAVNTTRLTFTCGGCGARTDSELLVRKSAAVPLRGFTTN